MSAASAPTPSPAKPKRPWQRWLLWLFPLLLLVIGKEQKSAYGHYGLSDMRDPEYCYLLNAVSMIQGYQITHWTHPGTTLKVLSAAPVALAYKLHDADRIKRIDNAVFSNPETYLAALWWFLLGLTVLTLCLLLARWLWQGKATLPVLLLLCGLCLHDQVWYAAMRASPETLLLPICMAFVWLLVRHLDRDEATVAPHEAILLGALFAFALATKTTTLLLGVIPFFILRGWRARLAFGYITLASYVMFSFPIVGQYRSMFSFIHEFSSAETNSHLPRGLKMLPLLPGWTPILCLVLVISIAALAVLLRQHLHGRAARAREMLLLSLIAQGLTLAVTSLHPVARYLIPAQMLCAVDLYCLWLLRAELASVAKPFASGWRLGVLASVAVFALFGEGTSCFARYASNKAALKATRTIEAHMAKLPADSFTVVQEGVSCMASAFHFGLLRNERGRFHDPAERKYGRTAIHNRFTGEITTVEGINCAPTVLEAANKGTLVVRAIKNSTTTLQALEAIKPGLKLKKDFEAGDEVIYRSE